MTPCNFSCSSRSFAAYGRALFLGIVLSMTLTACLPGKEEEKKVLARVEEERKDLAAKQLAANLAIAAERHLTTAAATSNNEMITVRCDDNRVIAFVPNTSALTEGGTMPPVLAGRLRTTLATKHGAGNVMTKDNATTTVCPAADPADLDKIAENAPVLLVASVITPMDLPVEDDPAVVAVNMLPCSGGKPGVIVEKHVRQPDGSVTVNVTQHCGTAAPTSSLLPSISVSSNAAADWKTRLSSSNTNANTNYSCITSGSACVPISQEQIGTQILCDDKNESIQYIANPQYNPATFKFVPKANPEPCGKPGWVGELAARVKSKRCQIIRNGVAQEIPATIHDIAYVGARCWKEDVTTTSACPAGVNLALEHTGHMVTTEDLAMNRLLSLTPRKQLDGKNYSSISYERWVPSGNFFMRESNMTNEDRNLLSSGISNMQRAGNILAIGAEPMFSAGSNLSTVANANFDQTFVTELKSLNRINLQGTPTCYAMAQDCHIDTTPNRVEMVMEREQRMVLSVPSTPTYPAYTACRATMANLFEADKRESACQAARQWNELATNKGVIQHVLDNWDANFRNRSRPVYNANVLLTDKKSTMSYGDSSQLNNYEDVMINALSQQSVMTPRLRYALAIGQTCSPPVVNGVLKVQEDMYGYCMPSKSSAAYSQALTTPLKSCQSTCPGECTTVTVTDVNGVNLPPAINRLRAAEYFEKYVLLPRLPFQSAINYSELENSSVSSHTILKGATPENIIPEMTKSQSVKGMINNIDNHGRTNIIASEVSTFEAIDRAIDRLREPSIIGGAGLDEDRLARASIVLFGGSWDTKCVEHTKWWEGAVIGALLGGSFGALVGAQLDKQFFGGCKTPYNSPYFGRNICEPEQPLNNYQCHYCLTPAPNPLTGKFDICPPLMGKKKDMFVSNLEDRGINGNLAPRLSDGSGINTPLARQQWCQANRPEICVLPSPFGCITHARMKVMDIVPQHRSGTKTQVHSLVGFLGRHFPNVKLYYMDFEGHPQGLGEMCSKNISNFSFDKPHSFYPSFTAGVPHNRVWFGQRVTSDINEVLRAIENSTAGGKPSAEAGKKVCEAKYPNGVNISYDDPPIPFTSNLSSFESQMISSCDKPIVYNPLAIAVVGGGAVGGVVEAVGGGGIVGTVGTGTVGTGTVTGGGGIGVVWQTWPQPTAPFIPSPTRWSNSTCIKGFIPHSLKPC